MLDQLQQNQRYVFPLPIIRHMRIGVCATTLGKAGLHQHIK